MLGSGPQTKTANEILGQSLKNQRGKGQKALHQDSKY